jgi:iron(III) transport system ATP-binding protein
MMPDAITLSNLEKRYGAVAAVDDVNFSVPEGAFLVLLGPSGCGKTTIMRMLAGLEAPTGGEIRFGGELIADSRNTLKSPGQRNIGLVFQSYALWPHMTVEGNVAWPLSVAGWKPSERKARVEEVLTLTGIQNLAKRYPGEISGGQQQRVAIARTLAPRPKIILFDEPLSNLDAKLRTEMRAELLRIHRASGATSVYVTHDQVEAMTMATHLAVLNHGQVQQFGTPRELLERPQTPFVATFVGTPPGNLLPATARGGKLWIGETEVGASPPGLEGACSLLYKAQHLRVQTSGGSRRLRSEFAESTPVAGAEMVTGWFGKERLTAVVNTAPDLHLGEPFYFELPAMPDAMYDPSGRRLEQVMVAQ